MKNKLIKLIGSSNGEIIISDMFKRFRPEQLEAMLDNEILTSFMEKWLIAEDIAQMELTYVEADSIIEEFYQNDIEMFEL